MKPAEFLERFVAPLVEAGPLHVGPPLGASGLERLLNPKNKPPPELDARICEGRLRVARSLLLDPIPPRLDVASLRLAVALHDLLFLLHPGAAGMMVRDRRLIAVADNAAALARLPATRDADELVDRHTLLHAFPALSRVDVRVLFWAGKQEFHGVEPPSRLKAWPSIRQVREERWRASCFAECATHPLGAPVVRALYEGSPLTDLLNPARAEPRLSLARSFTVLSSPEVCRLVAYQLLSDGIDRVGGALAQAALVELESPTASHVRFVLAFIAHLHLCLALGHEAREPQRDRRADVLRAAASGDRSLRDFYGLYPALRRSAAELAAPADTRRDGSLEPLLQEYSAACEAAAGQNRVVELAVLVGRATGMKQLMAGAP